MNLNSSYLGCIIYNVYRQVVKRQVPLQGLKKEFRLYNFHLGREFSNFYNSINWSEEFKCQFWTGMRLCHDLIARYITVKTTSFVFIRLWLNLVKWRSFLNFSKIFKITFDNAKKCDINMSQSEIADPSTLQ